MKPLSILCAILLAALASAQSTAPVSGSNAASAELPQLSMGIQAETNSVQSERIRIAADKGEFWFEAATFSMPGFPAFPSGMMAIYRGNVRATNAEISMTCGSLVIHLTENGDGFDCILAQTNVVIDAVDSDGRPVHARGSEALYRYSVEGLVTNKSITLNGDPAHLKSDKFGTLDASPIIWDMIRNRVSYENPVTRVVLPEESSKTNAPASGTHPSNF